MDCAARERERSQHEHFLAMRNSKDSSSVAILEVILAVTECTKLKLISGMAVF